LGPHSKEKPQIEDVSGHGFEKNILRKNHRLRVFQGTILRRTLEPMISNGSMEKVTL
jgi:hypothetical protein